MRHPGSWASVVGAGWNAFIWAPCGRWATCGGVRVRVRAICGGVRVLRRAGAARRLGWGGVGNCAGAAAGGAVSG
jgi:hypothetical protein